MLIGWKLEGEVLMNRHKGRAANPGLACKAPADKFWRGDLGGAGLIGESPVRAFDFPPKSARLDNPFGLG